MKKIALLFCVIAYGLAAAAQTASRVVGFATYGSDTTVGAVDTGGYIYFADRGGSILLTSDYPVPTFSPIDFVTRAHGLTRFDSAWAYYDHGSWHQGFRQIFDANNNIAISTQWYGTQYVDSFTSYNYLSQRVANVWSAASMRWDPNKRYLYNYDGYGQLQELIIQDWDVDSFRNTSRTTYTYSGYLSQLNEYSWSTSALTWHQISSTHYYYTASRIDSFIDYNGSTSVMTDKGIYHYPASDTTTLDYYNSSGVNYLRVTDAYDAGHMKISSTTTSLDHASLNTKQEWAYNSFNQVTVYRTYVEDTTGAVPLYNMHKFYYELYATTVPALNANAANLQIYPVPAQEMILVKKDWTDPTPFTVSLCDMQGRVLRSWNETATNAYQQTIPLVGLAPGGYVLRIVSDKENVAKQFVKE